MPLPTVKELAIEPAFKDLSALTLDLMRRQWDAFLPLDEDRRAERMQRLLRLTAQMREHRRKRTGEVPEDLLSELAEITGFSDSGSLRAFAEQARTNAQALAKAHPELETDKTRLVFDLFRRAFKRAGAEGAIDKWSRLRRDRDDGTDVEKYQRCVENCTVIQEAVLMAIGVGFMLDVVFCSGLWFVPPLLVLCLGQAMIAMGIATAESLDGFERCKDRCWDKYMVPGDT